MLKRNKAANSRQKNATCMRVRDCRVRGWRDDVRRKSGDSRELVRSGYVLEKLRVEFTDFTRVAENISGNWPGNDHGKAAIRLPGLRPQLESSIGSR